MSVANSEISVKEKNRLETNAKKWTHECEKCGAKCCSVLSLEPMLSSKDIETIQRHTGMEIHRFVKESNGRRFLKRDSEHERCIFLDDNNKCTIYEARPFDCRLFPLDLNWSEDSEDGKERIGFILHSFCPASYLMKEWMIDEIESKIESAGFVEIIDQHASLEMDEIKQDNGCKFLRFIADEIQKKVDK